jgi:hypothetical protein
MMKNIIHDWDDAESLAILRRVGDAMRLHSGGDSTLAILDLVRSSRRGKQSNLGIAREIASSRRKISSE